MSLPEAVYLKVADDVYQSTVLSNAGWYEEGQHGGSLAALIVGHVQTVPTLTPMEISRVTVELFRIVPLVKLRIATEIVREGKRIQTVVAQVMDEQDNLLSQATVQRLRIADRPVPDASHHRPNPDLIDPSEITERVGKAWGVGEEGKIMFHRHAMEVREAIGGFGQPGPATVWFRFRRPVIEGQPNDPVQLAVAAGDFCNGISSSLDMSRWVFMNPDLTVHLARHPVGEWVALDARSYYEDTGRGLAGGDLYDTFGWFGRSNQSLYLDYTSH